MRLQRALLCATLLATLASGQSTPGAVVDFQKVSQLQGDMTNPPGDGDQFGIAVARMSDLNDDGVPDMAVGSWDERAWIVFLRANGKVLSDVVIDWQDPALDDPLSFFSTFGASLTCLGDLDGDGLDELVIGAEIDGLSPSGTVYIVFLNPDGSIKDSQRIGNGFGGLPFVIPPGAKFGAGLAAPGDVDGDGVVDLFVGAPCDSTTGPEQGRVHLLLLDAEGTVKAAHTIDGSSSPDLTLEDGDHFGRSIAFLGDLSGDGTREIAVGAPGAPFSPDGEVFILSLDAGLSVTAVVAIDEDLGGSGGSPPATNFGWALSEVGDLDGNGVPDLATSVFSAFDDRARAYFVFLEADGAVASAREVSAAAGTFPGSLVGDTYFGVGLAALGDLDGDTRPEFAFGAPGFSGNGDNGGVVWISYLDWSEWIDLGGGLAGTAGTPHLDAVGTLVHHQPVTFTTTDVVPGSLALFVIGLGIADAPFKGGLLVPSPDIVVGPVATGAGTVQIVATWPGQIPAGLASYYQLWAVDPGAVFGFSASNAVAGIAP